MLTTMIKLMTMVEPVSSFRGKALPHSGHLRGRTVVDTEVTVKVFRTAIKRVLIYTNI